MTAHKPDDDCETYATKRLKRRWRDWLEVGPTATDLSRFRSDYDQAKDQIDRLERSNPGDWVQRAWNDLETACDHFACGDLEPAWSSIKSARREAVRGLDSSELAIEAVAVRQEASEKLSSWRLATVNTLLGVKSADPWDLGGRALRLELAVGVDPEPSEPLSTRLEKLGQKLGATRPSDDPAAQLRELEDQAFPAFLDRVIASRRILDEHTDNVYVKQGMLAHTIALALLIIAVILVLLTLAVLLIDWSETDDPEVLTDWRVFFTVLILGALGAVLSSATDTLREGTRAKIPDLRVRRVFMRARPLIGSASAVAVVIVLQSGVTAVSLDPIGVYATAVAAGFSERLVSRTVERASKEITA